MITAVLTSDNHLGANYAKFRPDRLEQRRLRLQQAFKAVVDAAIARKVDIFLQAGDLFDRPDPRNMERLFVAGQLARLREAGIPVFAIAGNHDSPRGTGYGGGIVPQEEADMLGGLRLFRSTSQFDHAEIDIRGERIRISGMSTDFNLPAGECPLQGVELRRPAPGTAQIVLLHYGVHGWMPEFGDEHQEPILSLPGLERLEADAICVGHLHQRLEKQLDNRGLLLNPGSTERMNFGEEGLQCGYSLLTVDKGTVSSTHVSLQTQRMHTLKIELPTNLAEQVRLGTNIGVAEALTADYRQQVRDISAHDQLLRVHISGQMPRDIFREFDLMELQRLGSEANFHCQIETERITVFDPDNHLPVGYGVSFDVAQELESNAKALSEQHNGDAARQETYALALQQVMATFDRLTRGGSPR